MCGIAGIFDTTKNDNKRIVKRMLRTMKHRGPDGQAYKHHDFVSLGLTRLSMNSVKTPTRVHSNTKNDILCVFNGEIYNHLDLRKTLRLNTIPDKKYNDADVIIPMYEKYGKDFVKYLDGMFSIVIMDKDKLLLFSDKFGIKPLYYSLLSDGKFVFSSELRPILKISGKHEISKSGLASYLQYRFIAHPLTIFSDIFKIEPRQILEISQHNIKKSKYKIEIQSTQSLKPWVKSIINYDSQEVKIGTFLSGGLDSSILNMILNGKRHAFTIKYDINENIDETKFATCVAKKQDLIHHIVYARRNVIKNTFDKTILSLEEPLYSTVSISTYLLAKSAKKYVKGIISGDGADEMFIGYNYIRTAMNNTGKELQTYKKQIAWLSPTVKHKLFNTNIHNLRLIKNSKEPLESIMIFERDYRLPDYHLFRLDKMTMANSVEGRVPFLSQDIINYLSGIPLRELYTNPPKQHLIKTFSNILPSYILNRKKQPFTAPWTDWIDGCLYKDITRTFKNKSLCDLFDVSQPELLNLINKPLKQYSDYTAIWGLYVLLKWAKTYKKYIIF